MKALYKKRLLRLADVIEIKHKLFNMSSWVQNENDAYLMTMEPMLPNCNTSACMAGFAVAEFHPHMWEDYEDAFNKLIESDEEVPGNGHIQTAARELLGLTWGQEDRLFYHDGWPEPYKTLYQTARRDEDTKGMAKAAAKYLRAIANGKVTI